MAGPAFKTLSPESERSILTYASLAHNVLLNQFSMRGYFENIDRYYMREGDWTEEQIRSRLANFLGDKTKMQDVTVPIVMPQVESALGYMANVFLTGYPMFGVSTTPSQEAQAQMMETIIAENAITAGWARQLVMFFRDGFKYNFHALEVQWESKKVASIDTDLTMKNSAKVNQTLWHGNTITRMDPYNFFFDPRVHPAEIHSEGEYAGYIKLYSRVRMKKFIANLPVDVSPFTIERALQTAPASVGTNGSAPFAYYIPIINPWPTMNNRTNLQTFDWMAWAANVSPNKKQIRYSNVYEIMTLYARILPKDFGIMAPQENTPQVWKFVIVNGSVVLYSERLSNAHGYIPILCGQPIEDGLDFQTKSFAMNVSDMQDIASSMLNGFMASKRRLVGDRALYDPSRVREKDINSRNPAAKIPVRPSAYGKPVQDAVYAFPYRDEQTNSLVQGAQMMVGFADKINGVNPAQQGQFVKGNKTLHEYEDVMGHGNNHNQLMAIMTESQVFTPMKEILKLNILQYQEDGVIFNAELQQQVEIKTADLRNMAVQFKISDGLIPKDKILSTDAFTIALQTLQSVPSLGAAYNVAPMFSYLLKEQGADISPFEKSPLQIQFDQMTGSWQQVAAMAIKEGKEPPPQPQMPPELIAELQAKQKTGGVGTSESSQALASTQGGAP